MNSEFDSKNLMPFLKVFHLISSLKLAQIPSLTYEINDLIGISFHLTHNILNPNKLV